VEFALFIFRRIKTLLLLRVCGCVLLSSAVRDNLIRCFIAATDSCSFSCRLHGYSHKFYIEVLLFSKTGCCMELTCTFMLTNEEAVLGMWTRDRNSYFNNEIWFSNLTVISICSKHFISFLSWKRLGDWKFALAKFRQELLIAWVLALDLAPTAWRKGCMSGWTILRIVHKP
jgi:hypothetical protein